MVMPGSNVQETITCTGLSLPVRFGVDDGRIIFCIAWDYKTNQNQDKRIDEHSKEAYCENVQETITSIRFCLDDGRIKLIAYGCLLIILNFRDNGIDS